MARHVGLITKPFLPVSRTSLAFDQRMAGSSWAFDYSGNTYNTTYHVVEHPTTGTLYAAVSTVHDLYQSTYLTDSQIDGGSGAILYSTDDGATWQMLEDFGMPVIWLAIDPTNNDIMYASVVNSSSGGIFKTTNLSSGTGASWNITTTPTRTEGHPYNVKVLDDGTVVTTWSGRRAPSFTASSGVFISTDGGASWIDRSANDDMYYWTKDITIDPHDATQDTWYVSVFSGWGGLANNKGGLYKSTDRGQNWNRIYNGYRVESATIHPTNPDVIYVSTEDEGLWYSNDLTAATPTFNNLPDYHFQHPMRVYFNPNDTGEVWVMSFGNGMNVGTVGGGGNNVDEILASQITVFPNPTKDWINFKSTLTGEVNHIRILDATGRVVRSEPLQGPLDGKSMYLGNLDNGAYQIEIQLGDGHTIVSKTLLVQ